MLKDIDNKILTMLFLSMLIIIGCKPIAKLIPDESINEEEEIISQIKQDKIPTLQPLLPSKDFINKNNSIDNGELNPSILQRALSIIYVEINLKNKNQEEILRRGNGVLINKDPLIVIISKSLLSINETLKEYEVQSVIISQQYKGNSQEIKLDASIINEDRFNVTFLQVTEKDINKVKEFKASTNIVTFNDYINVKIDDSIEIINFETRNDGAILINLSSAEINGKYSRTSKQYTEWISINENLPNNYFSAPAYNMQGEFIGFIDSLSYNKDFPLSLISSFHLSNENLEKIKENVLPNVTIVNNKFNFLEKDIDNILISNPVYSTSKINENGGVVLYDYNFQFNEKLYELYYQYATQGLESGDMIEERWYLNNIMQEDITTTYKWKGDYSFFTNVLRFSFPLGMPEGFWQTEIYVNNQLKAKNNFYIQTTIPKINYNKFMLEKISNDRYLLSFDYENIIYDSIFSFVVYANDQVVYNSENIDFKKKKSGKAMIVYENIDTENDFINMEVDFFMNYDFIGNAKLSFGEKNE